MHDSSLGQSSQNPRRLLLKTLRVGRVIGSPWSLGAKTWRPWQGHWLLKKRTGSLFESKNECKCIVSLI